jgi:von Willebrand factor type A domain
MKTTLPLVIGCFALLQPLSSETLISQPAVEPKPRENKVQIALLLDTSNSMDGLIDQARTQLWKVVNTFIDARREGEAPFVEVALYEYGNNHQHVGNHYIRQVQPLTRDLDELSKQMFALTTNGGEEYCGAAIQRAIADLAWDDNPKTYKTVFIAGNEPFTQGPVEPQQACRDAYSKNIVINTIHCGSRDEGISGSWNDGAALAGGKFMIIDQDRSVAHIEAPQDQKISELGIKLNETYLGYGRQRAEGLSKQLSADKDAYANEAVGAPVERAISKASSNYHNVEWDLVDAVREKKVDLAKINADELPESFRKLDADELKQRVEEASKQRSALQSEIATLNKEREAFIAVEQNKQAKAGEKTLDQAIVETARQQASSLGYGFEN